MTETGTILDVAEKFLLRLPPELRARVQAQADKHYLKLTQQMLLYIERGVSEDEAKAAT